MHFESETILQCYVLYYFYFSLKKFVNLSLVILKNYILSKKYVLSIFKCCRLENYHLIYIIWCCLGNNEAYDLGFFETIWKKRQYFKLSFSARSYMSLYFNHLLLWMTYRLCVFKSPVFQLCCSSMVYEFFQLGLIFRSRRWI